MFKDKFFRSFWTRTGLKMLAWQVGVMLVSWLLFRWWYWIKNYSDVLFMVAAMELTAAGVNMVNRPYEVNLSPWGVTALPVQPSEQERAHQALAQYIEAKTFATLLLTSGVISILIGLGMVYIK